VPEDSVPNSLHFVYNNLRRGFEKRGSLRKLVDMSFTAVNGLQINDLEDTIDKA